MNFNKVKIYFRLKQKQRAERKKVINFIKRIKKSKKYREKMRKKGSLAFPIT